MSFAFVFTEHWRAISGYEGYYEVSSFGQIRSLDRTRRYRHGRCKVRGQLLRFHSSNSGYLMVNLCGPQRQRCLYVHILVAEAFLGKRPTAFVVHHVDANKSNNYASNLDYISSRENLKLGSFVYGESHCYAKLKFKDIPKIRSLAEQGWHFTPIAERFGVTNSTIWAVIHGKTWTHVA